MDERIALDHFAFDLEGLVGEIDVGRRILKLDLIAAAEEEPRRHVPIGAVREISACGPGRVMGQFGFHMSPVDFHDLVARHGPLHKQTTSL